MATVTVPQTRPTDRTGAEVPPATSAAAPPVPALAAADAVYWADPLALKIWVLGCGIIWVHVVVDLLLGLGGR